ncbi:MFS transporter [Arthrobacter psychrolactophilus]|uniref:MFS transporter n=1 Tax=Arthrobacter psychrolactophilus TaxID=92442 RepID=A0A2V5IRU3_9MICC|nr:MFS transporter [Arthrobacter psychrolactophilus]PYI38731.1 MFS transporter [Arthrobacter psychrolactophilus]
MTSSNAPSQASHPLPQVRRRAGKRWAFWASASVLALVLWSSGAPSTLYPIYAAKWQLSPLTITTIFASYPLTLLVILPIFGNLSDWLGRRRVMIAGVALIAASAIVFALAPHVAFLFIGRILQGAGAGLAMGAGTAALMENNTASSPRFASSMATLSTATGLTLALVVSGALAQFFPMPLLWSYVVLLILSLASIAALLRAPDDNPGQAQPWRPQAPRLAQGIRMLFSIATLSVTLSYCVGAIFLSLGAHMIREFTHTGSTATIGALLGCSAAAIGITALFLSRIPARASVWVGAGLTIASLGFMAAASSFGSMSLFLGWCVVGGIAYSFAFTGGLGLINQAVPHQHRGATLSLLYLIAYAFQAGTAIGVGALATSFSLSTAVSSAALSLAGLSISLLVLMTIASGRGRTAHDTEAPASTASRIEF